MVQSPGRETWGLTWARKAQLEGTRAGEPPRCARVGDLGEALCPSSRQPQAGRGPGRSPARGSVTRAGEPRFAQVHPEVLPGPRSRDQVEAQLRGGYCICWDLNLGFFF
ncbi:hypothetical protein Salat_2888600 [Sesamum alatum]|uniref:Uncharacterized protein n=1 Tax=Sesamum alatum TaxID=300844 RepID=A0AAE2C807_9LAMI|nr:hypothetical protein Salat_2888600 [Sesamum alatum]